MLVELSSWSPDGSRIAFTAREPSKPFRIYLVGRDGGPLEELAEGVDNQGAPSWSPDGKTIVYGNVLAEETHDGWIRRVDLATRQVQIVPGSHNFRTARWSPDGKYIAALNWQARELMLFDVHTERWRTLARSINGDNISWSSNSQSVFVDPKGEPPAVEQIRIRDGQRTIVANLDSLFKVPGGVVWFGLTPGNEVIVHHLSGASDVYALKWTDH
jgi:Tol biopolymer transport system component